jgi:hypothetical protein
VVDSLRGGKTPTSSKRKAIGAPPPPPPKDPKYKVSSRAETDEEHYFTTDTETERAMLEYDTPPESNNDPPSHKNYPKDAHEHSESDVDMTGRITAREKGKGRARFASPIVQPTPILQDARKAEMERRKRAKERLEEAARKKEEELEEIMYQLTVLESERTALEEAEKLEKDLQDDEPEEETPAKEKSESEGAQSATEDSGREHSAREDDAPTTQESDPTPPPTPKPTEKKRKEVTHRRKMWTLRRKGKGKPTKTPDSVIARENQRSATTRRTQRDAQQS